MEFLEAAEAFVEGEGVCIGGAEFDAGFVEGVLEDAAGHAGPGFDVAAGFFGVELEAGTGCAEFADACQNAAHENQGDAEYAPHDGRTSSLFEIIKVAEIDRKAYEDREEQEKPDDADCHADVIDCLTFGWNLFLWGHKRCACKWPSAKSQLAFRNRKQQVPAV